MVQRTADELVAVHSARKEWDAAIEVATAYHLDCDPVYRARWQGKPVSTASVAENLRPMVDRYWVGEECATRVSDSFEGQTVLIEYGLAETESNGGVGVQVLVWN